MHSLESYVNNQTDQMYEPIQKILSKDADELKLELDSGITAAGTVLSPAQYDGSLCLTEYISETLWQENDAKRLELLP